MRRWLALALLVTAVGCSRGPAAAPPTLPASPQLPPATEAPSPTPDPGRFDVARAMETVRALVVEVGKREAGTAGDALAADYVAGRIRALGWHAERQVFPLPQGGESSNVIGSPAGFATSDPYLLVGGHLDSLRGPGANDNATGIAVALEIARAVGAQPAALPVRFVAFGAEEKQPLPGNHHHVGSRFYVQHMTPEARRNLVAFVNVDMVGWGNIIYCPRMISGPREGTERCLRTAGRLGIAARERVTPDWSDNGSFLSAGMNAAWLWTGDDPCCNHTPKDTMARVQPAAVDRSGRLALAILRSYTR